MPNPLSLVEFIESRMGMGPATVKIVADRLSDEYQVTTTSELAGVASLSMLESLGISPSVACRVLIELVYSQPDMQTAFEPIEIAGTLEEYRLQFVPPEGKYILKMPLKNPPAGMSLALRSCGSKNVSGFYVDPAGIGYVSYPSTTERVARFTRESLVMLQLITSSTTQAKTSKLFKALFVPSLTIVAVKSISMEKTGRRIGECITLIPLSSTCHATNTLFPP